MHSLVTAMRGDPMKKIMFLCTANSCRSQMAEGFAKEYGKGIVEVYSAGLMAAGVQQRAIAVMKEIGIDISKQQSKRNRCGPPEKNGYRRDPLRTCRGDMSMDTACDQAHSLADSGPCRNCGDGRTDNERIQTREG